MCYLFIQYEQIVVNYLKLKFISSLQIIRLGMTQHNSQDRKHPIGSLTLFGAAYPKLNHHIPYHMMQNFDRGSIDEFEEQLVNIFPINVSFS